MDLCREKRKEQEGEGETYICLQSVGHRTVSAYLHVDSSVIELIMALGGSEQTNLTCNVIKNQDQ